MSTSKYCLHTTTPSHTTKSTLSNYSGEFVSAAVTLLDFGKAFDMVIWLS